MGFKLTKGQSELIDEICYWFTDSVEQDYVYAGYAGTGKTSIIPYILKRLNLEPEQVLFVAFTGKATNVLMQKGFNAQTIHSAFYDLVDKPLIENGRVVYKNGRVVTKTTFEEKQFIDSRYKLIFIDEWSMVDEDKFRVIYKFGLPVIASGDPDQIDPIFGISPFAKRIKFFLTEITRQSENNGIIQLANDLRQGYIPTHYKNYYNDAIIFPKECLTDKRMKEADVILTTKNKTRNYFNNRMREILRSYGKLPNVGDVLVCRKNCRNMVLDGMPLVNGTAGKIIHPIIMDECNLSQGIYRMDFRPDYITSGDYYEAIPCDYDFLNEPCGEKEINKYNMGLKFEYGYALTVMLAQGSQYDNVLYWDEHVGNEQSMRKIRYTAATRAIEKFQMYI